MNEDPTLQEDGDQLARLATQVRQLEREASQERLLRVRAETQSEHDSLELAMTVHELRIPLTAIIGFASTILAVDTTWSEAEIREFVTIIGNEADKMKYLLDDLVAVTREKAQQPSIRRVPTSLKEILDIAKIQLVTVTPRHKLAEIIPENLPMALADRQRIAQVLVNLVRNAAEHSPSDTTIEIVASTEEQTMIRIDVRDEGAGIPSAAKTSVFEAFRRGDDTPGGQESHLGLGLAICKAIIESHGGRIWAEEHERGGTRLSFTLPAA
jgi:two-component system sensor histidine kinase KdpD